MELLNEQELLELVQKTSLKYFKKPYIDNVEFNKRLRTTGGRYIPSLRKIELNPKYFLEENEEEFLGIIKHELCHYHLHIEGKGYRHRDTDFQELLQKTGSPRFCSPLKSESTYCYKYRCKNCGLVYRRKRRVNTTKFYCGKCKGKLEYIGETADE